MILRKELTGKWLFIIIQGNLVLTLFDIRFLLGNLLLPKLEKAVDKGEDARLLTVLAAGVSGSIDLNDLGLKKHSSLKRKADSATRYNDSMVEVISLLSLL
jgi:hypothetical protein